MEPKKNPKSDVSRNSSLYFAVGLTLMLFVTYQAINYKTYDKSDIDIGQLNLDDELDMEEQSEWADRTLGTAASVEDEEQWRDLIQDMADRDEGLPYHVYSEKEFIGGKQFQRAKELMKATMLGEATLYWAGRFYFASI